MLWRHSAPYVSFVMLQVYLEYIDRRSTPIVYLHLPQQKTQLSKSPSTHRPMAASTFGHTSAFRNPRTPKRLTSKLASHRPESSRSTRPVYKSHAEPPTLLNSHVLNVDPCPCFRIILSNQARQTASLQNLPHHRGKEEYTPPAGMRLWRRQLCR